MFLLSIGHHMEAPGASNGTDNEFDLASEWVERIEEILSGDGFEIEIVPTGSLGEKVEFINSYKDATFAAELHFNANYKNAYGSECLYYPGSEEGKRFSEIILDEFEKRQIFQPNRGAKEGWYYSNGKKTGDVLYFLANTVVPAVIIEPEFISHVNRINKYFYEGCDSIAQAATRFDKWMDDQ